jgi:C1A family cysteine protease
METLYGKLVLSGSKEIVGTGWLPPRPDLRDYTAGQKQIVAICKKLGINDENRTPPGSVDLRKWCSPVENQGSIGSCTAHAGAGIVEYYENRAFNKHRAVSSLFLYKTTRNLMQVTGDAGGWLR